MFIHHPEHVGCAGCVLVSTFDTRVEQSACRHDRPASTCRLVCLPLRRSRHEAPTGRASLHLLHDARRWRAHGGACSSLPLALGRSRVLGNCRHVCVYVRRSRHEAPTGRASLHLLDNMHGGGGLEVGARVCLWHSGGESACRHDQAAPAGVCLPLRRSRHGACTCLHLPPSSSSATCHCLPPAPRCMCLGFVIHRASRFF